MRRKVILIVAALAVAAALLAGGQAVLGHDSRLDTCSAGVKGTPQLSFPMTHARDYPKRLPHLGISPELESDAPAYVVVFEGNVEIAAVGAPLPIDEAGNTILRPEGAANGTRGVADVICIVVDGEPNYYGAVDKAGIQP